MDKKLIVTGLTVASFLTGNFAVTAHAADDTDSQKVEKQADEGEGSCGADKKEGMKKEGEGSCGADKKEEMKKEEMKKSGMKEGEGSCGEGSCGTDKSEKSDQE